MASRLVTDLAKANCIFGGNLPHITPEINTMEEFVFDDFRLRTSIATPFLRAIKKGVAIAASNTFVVQAEKFGGFKEDYYYRIHVNPSFIDFQTVAASQSRSVSVWNAYPDTVANMGSIDITRPQGLQVVGPNPPLAMQPLQELQYTIVVGVSGPPSINSEILFNFDNVEDPSPVRVVGTRAIKFDVVPESPVVEKWQWLTDVIASVDNTEQRISLRGEVPRITQQGKYVFLTSTDIRKFYGDLSSAFGRLWIPFYQYATQTTQTSPIGTNDIYFDNARTDLRKGEYALVKNGGPSILVQISNLTATGAKVVNNLTAAIPSGSIICPGAPAILDDASRLSREAVNEVAAVSLDAKVNFGRSKLARTGATATPETFLNLQVLTKRPLANSQVEDAFLTGQQSLDDGGAFDIVSRWDYERVTGERQYKIDRILDPVQMDYWKAFLAYCKGSAKKFFIPTYRTDLQQAVPINEGANAIEVEGREYAEKIFAMPTHRYLEFETEGGILRTTVVSAGIVGDNSYITFTPALPSGIPYTKIKRISYLLLCRLASDEVTFNHYGLESILSLSIVTAEGI